MRIRSGYIRILTGPALNSGRPPEEFILGRDELVLTVKSKDAASRSHIVTSLGNK